MNRFGQWKLKDLIVSVCVCVFTTICMCLFDQSYVSELGRQNIKIVHSVYMGCHVGLCLWIWRHPNKYHQHADSVVLFLSSTKTWLASGSGAVITLYRNRWRLVRERASDHWKSVPGEHGFVGIKLMMCVFDYCLRKNWKNHIEELTVLSNRHVFFSWRTYSCF